MKSNSSSDDDSDSKSGAFLGKKREGSQSMTIISGSNNNISNSIFDLKNNNFSDCKDNKGSHQKVLNKRKKEKINQTKEEDTQELFLNHLSRLLQGNDQCAATCFYNDNILIATNDIYDISTDSLFKNISPEKKETKSETLHNDLNFRVSQIKRAMDILKFSYPSNSSNDYYEPFLDLLIENLNLHLYGQAGKLNFTKEQTRSYFRFYMLYKDPIHLAPFINTCLESHDLKNRIEKYCHSLHYVLDSKFLQDFRNNLNYKILEYDKKKVHAEMKIACYIMEDSQQKNDIIYLTNVYIGISRRVCLRCYYMFDYLATSYKSKFRFRTCSGTYYESEIPQFILSHEQDFENYISKKEKPDKKNKEDSLIFSAPSIFVSTKSAKEFLREEPDHVITKFSFKPLIGVKSSEEIASCLTVSMINDILYHKLKESIPKEEINSETLKKVLNDNHKLLIEKIDSLDEMILNN